jgi:hypothetical protein
MSGDYRSESQRYFLNLIQQVRFCFEVIRFTPFSSVTSSVNLFYLIMLHPCAMRTAKHLLVAVANYELGNQRDVSMGL